MHFTSVEIEGLGGAESPWATYYESLKAFSNRKMEYHVIDGENLIRNPNYEFELLLQFLRVSTKDFEFQIVEDHRMPCLTKPFLFCLNSSKGSLRMHLNPTKSD